MTVVSLSTYQVAQIEFYPSAIAFILDSSNNDEGVNVISSPEGEKGT